MADITMCSGKECKAKEYCYRFTATPCSFMQAYFADVLVQDLDYTVYPTSNASLGITVKGCRQFYLRSGYKTKKQEIKTLKSKKKSMPKRVKLTQAGLRD